MLIGYSKLGRSWNLDPSSWSAVGGDADVYRLLHRLATSHPEHTFYLLGRNSGEEPSTVGLPANVVNPWAQWRDMVPRLSAFDDTMEYVTAFDQLTLAEYARCDQHLVWAGQHGTSNTPIPVVGAPGWDEEYLTNPQQSFIQYCAYVLRGVNAWRTAVDGAREEVWLDPDPRNYLKPRDLKWPLREPVLAQFDFSTKQKHERYTDRRAPGEVGFEAGTWDPAGGNVWLHPTRYVYSGLELTALPAPDEAPFEPVGTEPFGILINENRKNVRDPRVDVVRTWVLANWPDCEVYGKWSPQSCHDLRREITTVPVEEVLSTMRRWRSTFTTPANGSGWATAKPWECFAAGTVCFFHPRYDSQGHVVPTLADARRGEDEVHHLAQWLRVENPDQLRKRVEAVAADDGTWRWLVEAQRRHYERAMAEDRIGNMIAQRLRETQ